MQVFTCVCCLVVAKIRCILGFFLHQLKRHFSGSPLRPQSRWKRWSYAPLRSSSVSRLTWAVSNGAGFFTGGFAAYQTEEIFEEKN